MPLSLQQLWGMMRLRFQVFKHGIDSHKYFSYTSEMIQPFIFNSCLKPFKCETIRSCKIANSYKLPEIDFSQSELQLQLEALTWIGRTYIIITVYNFWNHVHKSWQITTTTSFSSTQPNFYVSTEQLLVICCVVEEVRKFAFEWIKGAHAYFYNTNNNNILM